MAINKKQKLEQCLIQPQLFWEIWCLNFNYFFLFSKARGGPQKYGVTGWLQIQGLKKSDEGVYICHTKNKYGATYASARLKVIDGIFFLFVCKEYKNAYKQAAKGGFVRVQMKDMRNYLKMSTF